MISATTTASSLGGMTSDEAAEVFRSMKVETTSKTPYSDATQVKAGGEGLCQDCVGGNEAAAVPSPSLLSLLDLSKGTA